MKELRRNMRMVVALVMVLFIAFFAYFGYSVYYYGGRWFANPYNPRLSSQKEIVREGTVYDRAGETLAYTDDNGKRHYAKDVATRRAVSHLIGDNAGSVANGVETFHAQYLLGFKTNLIERLSQVFQDGERRGDDIHLTVSADLNAYISKNFPQRLPAKAQSDKKPSGAVVIMNYRTGDIYAMVSKPDFDPSTLEQDQDKLSDEESPLLNRATQGRYPPGSTFKVVTLAAVLDNIPSAQTRDFYCSGKLEVPNSVVTDAGNNVHGGLSLQDAFAFSCNVTFAQLTRELGYDRMGKEAENFGMGDNFLFRDLVVYNSTYPTDNRTEADLAWSGVGQGRVLVTPLHMAMIAAGIANDGVMMEPRLLMQVTGPHGQPRLLAGEKAYRTAVSPQTADEIRQDMIATVQRGTGREAQIKGYVVAGKTGSAEAVVDGTTITHAWFVGFVDDPAHPLAIAVLVERGESGGQVAAPLARKFLQYALDLNL